MEKLIEKLQGSVNYNNHLTMVSNLSATLELIKKCNTRLETRKQSLEDFAVWSPLFDFYKKQIDISERTLKRLKQHYHNQLGEMVKMPIL